MKKLLALILALGIVPIAAAQITLNICEADGVTPFDGSDIMVGTKLTLIVSSDANDYWSGGLFIAGQDRALATLSARDSDPNIRDYTESHYAEAGNMARVTAWKDSDIWGFDLYGSDIDLWGSGLYGSDIDAVAGDWFIIDYKAIGIGNPNVGFYDYSISWNDPDSLITFHHVPTRDFNRDEKVDIPDYVTLAFYWLEENCSEPNWCGGADISREGWVDMEDFALFEKFWLWGVPPGEEPNYPEDPNYPDEPADPNIIFSIVDANGLNEITINIGQTITLYVDMLTLGASIILFDVEVNISDPCLGSIDNTAYDPYDPPGLGTARILAEPRNEEYDDWGPGRQQEEGIEFYAISIFDPIWDGHLASFEFTCRSEGDVTLELVNWDSSNAAGLESITIHQIDPNSLAMMMGSGMSGMPQQTQSVQEDDTDGLVNILEAIWLYNEEVREIYSKDEWDAFVDSVKNTY
ncbi:MAG: hypothetical protein ACYS80_14065 [Planctomycetota bacterium]